MIRNVESCPYCNAVIAIDDGTEEMVANPDRVDPRPCPHLTCFCIGLDAGQLFEWYWEFGTGLRAGKKPIPIEDNELAAYLVTYPFLPPHHILKAEHVHIGRTAEGRAETRPGSGEITFVRGKNLITAMLDSFVIFSPQPREAIQEIQQLRKIIRH